MTAAEIVSPWREFPIDRVPRPVVLLGAPLHIGDQGFVDGRAKSAWLAGAIEPALALPDGLLDGLPGRRTRAVACTPLVISAVQPCEAQFWCDRGLRLLPAFRLTVSGLHQPCLVLDPDQECWWPGRHGAPQPTTRIAATVAEDDRTLSVPAFGGALTEFHHAEFVEYPTCVVGRAVTTQRQVPPGTAVPLVGVIRKVIGRLAAPLDGRVLLGQTGVPIAVLREAAAD